MDRVLMVVFAIATFVALAADLARGHTDKNNPSAPVEHHVRAFVNATIYLVVISLLVYYVVLPRLSGGDGLLHHGAVPCLLRGGTLGNGGSP